MAAPLVRKIGQTSIFIGHTALARLEKWISGWGLFCIFIFQTLHEVLRPPFRLRLFLQQVIFVGEQSLVIILLAALAIGSVFALQVGVVFRIFSAESQMGIATATALTRELAPMMTAFLVTGRAGSAITAELATMKVSEQIDAMEAMGVSPLSYLVVPRVLGSVFAIPFLSSVFVLFGMIGAYFIGTLVFSVDQGVFFQRIYEKLTFRDFMMGMEKSFVFSFVISLIACRYGLEADGGAKGVGEATTNSVITTLLSILVVDFIYTFIQIGL